MKINIESTPGGRIGCTLVELKKVSESRQKVEKDICIYYRILLHKTLCKIIKVLKVRAVKQG